MTMSQYLSLKVLLHALLLTRPGFVNADWLCKDLLPPFQQIYTTSVHIVVRTYQTTHRHHASHPNNCVVSLSAIINQNATCPSEARQTYRMTL